MESDSRDGTEGRDDMQQRSRGGDMSRTTRNCQHVPFMLISMLKLADILHFLLLISILFSRGMSVSLTCNFLCFSANKVLWRQETRVLPFAGKIIINIKANKIITLQ